MVSFFVLAFQLSPAWPPAVIPVCVFAFSRKTEVEEDKSFPSITAHLEPTAWVVPSLCTFDPVMLSINNIHPPYVTNVEFKRKKAIALRRGGNWLMNTSSSLG